ncbi:MULTISPECIES: hypothetical protein [unclassified Nitratiruptor]|uniref:hypothetical protein n=1 Tax=unclassified Nitratiruptor TaxID=2624044 RepID=UPI00191595E6|nr:MULTISPECIES: hypothetical protein [unclassified Nitratiruptor]BCD59437.1 hypothetical protein NitYY0810_C0173 [Nitratiruptor sp. YY08-10]BCD63361.1 hypothetical protein NitYY0814_C0173 [Nitratiruptor sp. YY08-14]
MFYDKQDEKNKRIYKLYLKASASLSRLFSDSEIPFLHYRAAENIFCFAFDAENLARDDIAVDAKKDMLGIGIKTFLHNGGNTLQKIAEFNRLRSEFENKSPGEIALKAAELRNYRLDVAKELHGLENFIYHCITREAGRLNIVEENMDYINLEHISDIRRSRNTVLFTDGINEYSFSLSKHTLFKRFTANNIMDTVDVEIIENPFEMLADCIPKGRNIEESEIGKTQPVYRKKYIYLPLYAPSDPNMHPALKSGLNQWNAGGRERHSDEVYIPVPAWIHKVFPDFFPKSNKTVFSLHLPNGKVLKASMCQQGRKGLMSNPNKALGRWLLRDVLRLPEGTLVTRKVLDASGIDSVRVEKIGEYEYKIDFASTGSYEKFKSTFEQ